MTVKIRIPRLLLPELNSPRFRIHGVHNGQGFQMIAQIPDHPAADLKSFFHRNAQALHDAPTRTPVGRLDEVGAARNPVLRYLPHD